ncbi:Rpp20 subunit of nuclear RNase MRP and P-domain-containing protein [Coniochaeta sp. 2T2.1]|nr:Rpp20 subunit of nuclear RNase MRP and P-domain-containing protein [Coniochaeta sp. 2T2.1]
MDTDTANKPLPNRPEAKLPPLSRGSRIQKRPLNRRTPLSLDRVDIDGYTSPSFYNSRNGCVRTPTCVYVSAKTPFMAVVKRVRKALENGGGGAPKSSKGLPLTARVAALSTGGSRNRITAGQDGTGNSSPDGEVIVLGTGKAIEKTLNVAAWFQKQSDCRVSLRTRSVAAVDDVVVGGGVKSADGDWDADADPDDADAEPEGDEVEDSTRTRMVSCLEVAVRLR